MGITNKKKEKKKLELFNIWENFFLAVAAA